VLIITERGNGARLTARGCDGDVLTAHGEKKEVGNFSRLVTWDLGEQIFVSTPSNTCYQGRLLWLTFSAFLCTYVHILC
jgi:hypothetical protein